MAPPVVAAGKIFVMDADAERLGARCAAPARQVWRTDLQTPRQAGQAGSEDAFGGGLAYADGKLFVASGYRLVAAARRRTPAGSNWVTRTAAPIHDAPTVAEGRVYADRRERRAADLRRRRPATPDWTYQALTEPARILAASSPAVSNGTLVASFASGELVAMRSDNGTELWNLPLSHTTRSSALSEIRDIAGRPVIYKGDVFAISHADVMADTDLRTGNVRWQLPVAGITTPWPAGDVVFAIDHDRPGDLRLARERPALLAHRPQRAGAAEEEGRQAAEALARGVVEPDPRRQPADQRLRQGRGGGASTPRPARSSGG